MTSVWPWYIQGSTRGHDNPLLSFRSLDIIVLVSSIGQALSVINRTSSFGVEGHAVIIISIDVVYQPCLTALLNLGIVDASVLQLLIWRTQKSLILIGAVTNQHATFKIRLRVLQLSLEQALQRTNTVCSPTCNSLKDRDCRFKT